MNPGRHLNAPRAEDQEDAQNPVPGIPGLHYTRTFLTPDQQADCIRRVDAASHEWRNDLARRTQHHGWRYDYRARAITPDMYLGSLPGWLQDLAERLMAEMLLPNGAPMFDRAPEQVIVNEYQGAQGIRPHVDHPGFGPTICTVSLLEDWEMDLSIRRNQNQHAMLEAGSCLTMTGESRSRWFHGIPVRNTEPDGMRRDRRISLTFRTVLNRDGKNDR